VERAVLEVGGELAVLLVPPQHARQQAQGDIRWDLKSSDAS
jgi:hypothetical protein